MKRRFPASGGMATSLPCFMMAMSTAIPGGVERRQKKRFPRTQEKTQLSWERSHYQTIFESMIFHFQKWDMFVPRRVISAWNFG